MHDEVGLPEPPEEINREVVERMLERYREELPLHPGRGRGGGAAGGAWPLGLASSSNRPLIDARAGRRSGLARCFRGHVSSEEVARGKPAPDVYLEAARRLGRRARARARRSRTRTTASAPRTPPGCASSRSRTRTSRRARTRSRSRLVLDSLAELTPDAVTLVGRRADWPRALVSTRPSRTQPLWPPRPIAFESATSTLDLARLVRDVVEVALGIRLLVVHRRREDAVVDREHAHHRLDRAGRAEAVAGHRLRRGDGELVRVVAEDVLDRLRLGRVAERRRGAVRVDVADALGLDSGAPSAARIISATPTDSGSGCAMWYASFEAP